MNERIKELMKQSGAYDYYEVNEGVDGDEQPMIKFAELVRADEREACAKVCDDLAAKDKLSNYYAVAARAIRERGEK